MAYDARFLDAKAEKKSDAEAHAYAGREMERIVARTALPETLANKSLAENHAGTWGRLLSLFQSASRQALFMTMAAFRDGGVKSADAWRKAVTHWALTGIVTQTVGTLIRDLISDDDEGEEWQLGDYMRAILMGPLTGAVHFGPIIDALGSLLGGFERRQAPSPVAVLTDLGKAFAGLA